MTRRVSAMTVASAAIAVFVLVGCDAMPGRPRQADQPLLPSQVMAFSTLYGQNCAGCHGAEGNLGAARPLNDALYLALVGPDRLQQIVAQGVPGTTMPGFAAGAGGALTEAQINALVGEMLKRWGRPLQASEGPLPPYDAAGAVDHGSGPGNPDQGSKVFADACARCHGPDGNGGDKGGAVVDAAYLALVSDQALRTAVIAGRTDLGMPDWREDIPGKPLTPQQISDVVAWLAARREPVMGRQVSRMQRAQSQP
jgi:mono/diheme cytochrome c family protein